MKQAISSATVLNYGGNKTKKNMLILFNSLSILTMVRNWPAIEHSLFVEWLSFQKKAGIEIRLVYYPPYHSKYNPIERCWAILKTHWNGELLDSNSKAVGWAGSMTWKGIKPVVHVLEKVYETGVSLTKKELKLYLSKLKRSLILTKWDIYIKLLTCKIFALDFLNCHIGLQFINGLNSHDELDT